MYYYYSKWYALTFFNVKVIDFLFLVLYLPQLYFLALGTVHESPELKLS